MRSFIIGFTIVLGLGWFATPGFAQSCAGHCGDSSYACDENANCERCYCDTVCQGFGDCCEDAASQCPVQHAVGTLCLDPPAAPADGACETLRDVADCAGDPENLADCLPPL
jgi:hypothetical protein